MAERFKLIVAVHLFIIKDNKILLLRRFNTGYEDGNYSVVAGHIDGNETIKNACIREANEEANITIKEDDLNVVHVMHRKSNDERIDFFVECKIWSGEITNNEPNKCNDLSFFDLNNLPTNIIPYVKFAIENYRNNILYSELGW